MRETISQMKGVLTVDVSQADKQAKVTFDDKVITSKQIAESLDKQTSGKYTATPVAK